MEDAQTSKAKAQSKDPDYWVGRTRAFFDYCLSYSTEGEIEAYEDAIIDFFQKVPDTIILPEHMRLIYQDRLRSLINSYVFWNGITRLDHDNGQDISPQRYQNNLDQRIGFFANIVKAFSKKLPYAGPVTGIEYQSTGIVGFKANNDPLPSIGYDFADDLFILNKSRNSPLLQDDLRPMLQRTFTLCMMRDFCHFARKNHPKKINPKNIHCENSASAGIFLFSAKSMMNFSDSLDQCRATNRLFGLLENLADQMLESVKPKKETTFDLVFKTPKTFTRKFFPN